MSFKSVLLGSSAHKHYTHNMSFDNSTTMEFGVLQPILAQYLEPNSRISVNARQLVRLSPMPTPSFARISLRNYSRYVKMTDVVPYYECLLSKLPYYSSNGSYTPTKMPYTSNRMLMYYLITLSRYTLYVNTSPSSVSPSFELVADTTSSLNSIQTAVDAFNDGFNFGQNSGRHKKLTIDYCSNTSALHVDIIKHHVNPENADEVVFFSSSGYKGNCTEYMLCTAFSQKAKILRKQLIGLGFSLSYEDLAPLSIAPILAYYKAWFDTFGLTREQPFETTHCFKLIKCIEDYKIDYSHFIVSYDFPSESEDAWFGFLNDLAQVYYSDPNSYIAAHRSNINNSRSYESLSLVGTDNKVPSSVGDLPSLNNFSKGITNVSLDLLRRLTRYVSKDSVIGQRLSQWVKVHYGADVSNSLFEQTNRINEWRTPIDIDDVMSQSDTVLPGSTPDSSTGEYLGAYAGKGLGFEKSNFTFKAPYHGFIFVMACIVPETKLFLGNDPTLYGVDLDTIPRPEFDSLGYEVTDGNVFYGDNGISLNSWKSGGGVVPTIPQNFGFIPRYSGFKFKKNIVNGDMYCGPCKTDLHPYYLDRIITSRSTSFTFDDKTNKWSYNPLGGLGSDTGLVGASTSWQQICRYPFMGNFNRIFYDVSVPSDVKDLYFLYPIDDKFIVQTVFDVKLSNWLKPIQNSYDTVDDVDTSTTSVTTN